MKHLTKEQRYVISSLRKAGHTLDYIAKDIRVHKSTVSRELKRNSNRYGTYSPKNAIIYAEERKERFSLKRKFTAVI
jgi:IS30 family transposase